MKQGGSMLNKDLILYHKQRRERMDITFTVNLWFLVALCLFFLVVGGLLFGSRSGGGRYR